MQPWVKKKTPKFLVFSLSSAVSYRSLSFVKPLTTHCRAPPTTACYHHQSVTRLQPRRSDQSFAGFHRTSLKFCRVLL